MSDMTPGEDADDWLDDDSLSFDAAEARFMALEPEPTVGAMSAEGQQAPVRGPDLPGGARLIRPSLTEVGVVTVSLETPGVVGGGMRVVQPAI